MISIFRSHCVILSLVLKRKWYDMIASGEKHEEYRAATPYWLKRLRNWDAKVSSSVIPVVEFRLGYSANAPRMHFWCCGIDTYSGMLSYGLRYRSYNPEWGEPDGSHFVIGLGGRVQIVEDDGGAK